MEQIWGPHLIVVPTSTMLNWETEVGGRSDNLPAAVSYLLNFAAKEMGACLKGVNLLRHHKRSQGKASWLDEAKCLSCEL
jgi:SNF2 family DNA or RNA helicase